MRVIVLKIIQWVAIVSTLILSVDALLAIYKTITFRSGINNKFDFFAVLTICLVLLVVTISTGLGALIGVTKLQFRMSARPILLTSLSIGVIFLLANAFVFSEWIEQALISKSESVLICVILSCVLLLSTMNKKEK